MTHTPTVLYSLRAQLTDPLRTVEPSHGDPAVTIAAVDWSRRRAGSDERAALRRACAQYVAAHDAAIAAALGETPERPARSHSAEIDLLRVVTL